jgi:hypothetical protein
MIKNYSRAREIFESSVKELMSFRLTLQLENGYLKTKTTKKVIIEEKSIIFNFCEIPNIKAGIWIHKLYLINHQNVVVSERILKWSLGLHPGDGFNIDFELEKGI